MDLRELIGIELPIIQAPMAGVQDSALAIAVCNEGGLGSLPCAMLSKDVMHGELQKIEARTTRPYNVNFFCHTPPVPDEDREQRWCEMLQPYFQEFGLDIDNIPAGVSRNPFDQESAELLEAFRPKVVSFHFGLPSDELLERVKAWGALVLSSATTLDEALWLESRGVDGIIVQGLEAGGHRGMFLSEELDSQVETFALLRQVVAAVEVPVIAAGGIADAQGVKAAMELGAAGVQVGTAYLLCEEATTSPVHRVALKGDGAKDTALTNLFSGRPARGILNRVMREIGPMNSRAPAFPLASRAMGPLRSAAEARGLGDFSPLWTGQNVTGCREISAAQLTRELAAEL